MKPLDTKQLVLEKTHDYCASGNPKIAVIMIHGIASDSSTFDDALKYLEKKKSLADIRFITFDLLGSGKSYKDDNLNYDYADQLGALRNSIKQLELDIPLVLVGHSLGTFIVTRYASNHKNDVKELILISPPIYTEQDFKNPAFETAIKLFKDAISMRNRNILGDKAFNNSLEKIALDQKNYQVLRDLTTPTVLIYGKMDRVIASYNIPELLKVNSKYLSGIMTDKSHGVTKDKFTKLAKILEEVLNAQDI